MMKNKYIKYILGTLTAHFSKEFRMERARLNWISHNIRKQAGNQVIIRDASVGHCSFTIQGSNNTIIIDNGADLSYSGFQIFGDNNVVHISGSTGIMSLVIRGNGCKMQSGVKSSMETCYMICMGQGNSITIGDDCMFSGGIELWNSDTHLITNLDGTPLNPSKPIAIGNHVWLGKNVKILKGVTIGDHSVVGMGAVVAKDIPAHSIAAGNPAKIIKSEIDWKKGFIEI